MVYQMLTNVETAADENISQKFLDACAVLVDNLPDTFLTIDKHSVTQAVELIDLFNQTKLILAAYQVGASNSFDQMIIYIKAQQEKRLTEAIERKYLA